MAKDFYIWITYVPELDATRGYESELPKCQMQQIHEEQETYVPGLPKCRRILSETIYPDAG